ncbi:hypothetical protein LRS74_14825 [Streptomyces sp. LX-29]|uniref:hypothetical protein n=1 Tax=Streptomyces sp. LX-29 TaxID=2900152 RepID=UPI00240DF82F|nr:hypothetical protein [Streptomyces sp. LX-29]WFB08182.1 hypothetical protein LRS74_14825 [Streptomyces sp. LX-29]
MAGEVFTRRAERWCRVREDCDPAEDLFPLDGDGFLGSDWRRLRWTEQDDRAGDGPELTRGALIAPRVAAARGAMVLLGEPGAGKTTVLRGLVAGLRPVEDGEEFGADGEFTRAVQAAGVGPEGGVGMAAGVVQAAGVGPAAGAGAYVWVDGPELTEATYEELLGRHLAARPAGLTVVIDQADESEMLRLLPGRLKRSLGRGGPGRPRLLLACRTGDYPQALTEVLRDRFGGGCALVDLAPLSRADAVALAESAGVPGEELIVKAVEVRAGALASVPLTLELLVRSYRDSGDLTGGAERLFADGIRLSLNEHDPNRMDVTARVTGWQQRLVAAGRIAARMVLSGRRTLWRGNHRTGAPHRFDLDTDDVVGGAEETVPTQSFEITPRVVDEVLATAVFTAHDGDRLSFRHSSFAAYLAARHLLHHRVGAAALTRLFLVPAPDRDTASIPAPLRETAAWLVALDPEHTDWLAAADPESLIAHSALVRSDAIKELVVRKMLERAAELELSDRRFFRTRWALDHPGLARQVAEALLSDPTLLADD